MKTIAGFIVFLTLASCSTQKPAFKTEKVCSTQALRYLNNPRNKFKRPVKNTALFSEIAATTRSMQLCYEDFKNRTSLEEFNTCLVVGVDDAGEMEFFNFGSQEVQLDDAFLKCARAVTKSVPYGNYGKNYILIQSYQFYVGK